MSTEGEVLVDRAAAEDRRGRAFYKRAAALLAIWAAVVLAIALSMAPDAYWYSYYAVDYSLGWIRRGLAGEIHGLFPDEHYFVGLAVLRWVPTLLFTAGLAVTARAILRSGRSERRMLLALLLPVLPFGFTYAVFSARTDLIGDAALAVLAVTLMAVTTARATLAASAAFGVLVAVLALIHEATPLLVGLGVAAALAVLAVPLTARMYRWCLAAALGPGLLVAALASLFGRRDVADVFCERIPHGPVNFPTTVTQLLEGFRHYIDYHDWACVAFLPMMDWDAGQAVREVFGLGIVPLTGSTVYGIAVFVIAMLALTHVTGVPLRRFADALRPHRAAVLLGLAMFVPLFLTGMDWIRWWVTIGFNLGLVFALYALRQPEIDGPVTARTRKVFAIGAILLGVLPVGIIPAFGIPVYEM